MDFLTLLQVLDTTIRLATPLLLACLLAAWRVRPVRGRVPVPVAHLTVRARDGIHLRLEPR